MEINKHDIVILKKLSHCKLCKNDTFHVTQTGTDFKCKCSICKNEKIIPAKHLKRCVKEVITSLSSRPCIMDF